MLLIECFGERTGQLIGAGGWLKAASYAAQTLDDLLSTATFHKFGNTLEIAVATSAKGNASHDSVGQIEFNRGGAGSVGLIRKMHKKLSFLS